jgi:hypothetical protein
MKAMRIPNRIVACIGLVAAMLVATTVNATFHLWRMTEVFSNADGTIQFLEMAALASGEQFVSGHTLTSTRGTVSHSFTVPTDLPGDSGGKRMIFATEGFAALGVVTPDYVLPNGFFFPAGGFINWAEVDLWTHPALPIDGRLSLDKETGVTAVNSPRNFLDQTGSVTAPAAALVYQGLWWRSPAASESGWGINVTHQGDILFATWFTYDTDGSGMWIVMAHGEKGTGASWTGKLYRTTGPSFDSNPFDPSKVVAAEVGTGTFTFTNVDTGSFAYTLNGVTQTKPIMRETFDTPVPTCTAGGTHGAAVNFQDLWWRAPAGLESGWGINITHQGDVIFATWFTYGADGKGVWIVMAHGTKTAANTFSGTLYRTTGPAFSSVPFDPTRVAATEVGTGTFTFSDAGNGTFAYTVNGISQSKPIMREVYASPVSVCK